MLGNRAQASDDFSRSRNQQVGVSPGNGVFAHKDGYNVLYGDGSTAWYGDAQQRFQYISVEGGRTGDTYQTHVTHAAQSLVSAVPDGYRYYAASWGPIGVEAWMTGFHMFDLSRGIDNVQRNMTDNTWAGWPPE
jgi:prepilin-type processing-associated H-X9-DG protein